MNLVGESRPTSDLLDEVLAALPATVVVAHCDAYRLVVSHAGVFVLDPGSGATGPTAERAAVAAQATRELLADHLTWVPFVDWFMVSAADSVPAEHDVVPLDLVPATVLEGHSVGDELMATIRDLLSTGTLAPAWYDGVPAATAPYAQPS